MEQDPLELARKIVDMLVEGQAEDVLLLDLREVSIVADCFVIASTTSERQARALLENVRSGVSGAFGAKPRHVEGESSSGWVLMDYNSVVVHLFSPNVRKYYDLEGFWRTGRVVVRLM
jgi:ribosome-associated protein